MQRCWQLKGVEVIVLLLWLAECTLVLEAELLNSRWIGDEELRCVEERAAREAQVARVV